jgi:hypothetical protein
MLLDAKVQLVATAVAIDAKSELAEQHVARLQALTLAKCSRLTAEERLAVAKQSSSDGKDRPWRLIHVSSQTGH